MLDLEVGMKDQEEKFNATISELRNVNSSLQQKLREEEAEKVDAIDRYRRERDARIAVETLQASLAKDLEKAQQDVLAANKRNRYSGLNSGRQRRIHFHYDAKASRLAEGQDIVIDPR